MPRPRKPDSPFRLHEGFLSQVAAVPAAGDTAVATVKERWTVKRDPDKPADLARFIATAREEAGRLAPLEPRAGNSRRVLKNQLSAVVGSIMFRT